MTKQEWLDAWEKPCVEAAREEVEWPLTPQLLRKVYRAIAPMLLEGFAEQFPTDELNYVWRLLSDSRQTHRDWIEYYEAQPGRLPPRFVHGLEDQRRIVVDYDRAVKVIESLRRLTLPKEQSE